MTLSGCHMTQQTSQYRETDSYRLIQCIYRPLSNDYELTYHRVTNLNSTVLENTARRNPDRIIMLSSLEQQRTQSKNLGHMVLSITEKQLHLHQLDTVSNTCIRQKEFQCTKEMIVFLNSPGCLKASEKVILLLKWLPITSQVPKIVSSISKDRKKHLCHAITRTKYILNMKKSRFNLRISRNNYY